MLFERDALLAWPVDGNCLVSPGESIKIFALALAGGAPLVLASLQARLVAGSGSFTGRTAAVFQTKNFPPLGSLVWTAPLQRWSISVVQIVQHGLGLKTWLPLLTVPSAMQEIHPAGEMNQKSILTCNHPSEKSAAVWAEGYLQTLWGAAKHRAEPEGWKQGQGMKRMNLAMKLGKL